MRLMKEIQLFEDEYQVYVEYHLLGKRAAYRSFFFGCVIILFTGFFTKTIFLFPVGYLFAAIALFGVLYLDRKGKGAKGFFGITHNKLEIGVTFKQESNYLAGGSYQCPIENIEEILFNSDKSEIIFRRIGKKNRAFVINDNISEEIVTLMLAIATKDSSIPYRILTRPKRNKYRRA